MNSTLRRIARVVTPDPVRRQARFIRKKRRIVATYGGVRRSPILTTRYLLFDRELDNFTYEIANTAELAAFVADVLGTETATVRRYIDELAEDERTANEISSRLDDRPDRNRSMPYGRRLGWYAIVRLRRPAVIVETGVHDGLGSTVLLRAIERNEAEGHPGTLVSFDVNPAAGWLVPDRLRERHQLVFGNAVVGLSTALAGRSVDLFIHDSDHSYAHETAEFETVNPVLSPAAVLMTDNAHGSSAFADFCAGHGLVYRFWREVPKGHFYPGAGIGMAVLWQTLPSTSSS